MTWGASSPLFATELRDLGMTSAPTVSVVTITYNHEAFIRDTLDGFVSQRVDFPVEFIIADDASTDGTAEIIQSYADSHPELIRPILRGKNVGIHANLTDAMSSARGRYLALCEGDDYWTDPEKLTKQVDYLDAHPEASVCFHPVRVSWVDGSTADSEFPPANWRRGLSINTLLYRNFIQTNSVMYRRLSTYDDVPQDIMPLDWYIHVRHAMQGKVAMLPDTMGVYRRHPQGVWYSADTDRERFWRKHGRGQAALLQALLGLGIGSRTSRLRVYGTAHWLLGQLASVPGEPGRDMILDTVRHFPRLYRASWVQRPLIAAVLVYQKLGVAKRRFARS